MTENTALITIHNGNGAGNFVKDPAVETETYPMTFALPTTSPSYCATGLTTYVCYYHSGSNSCSSPYYLYKKTAQKPLTTSGYSSSGLTSTAAGAVHIYMDPSCV
jgi:hypothetical protein